MSPSKNAYFKAKDEARKLGHSAKTIMALNTQALAQEIVDNLNLAPEDYIPQTFEGGVPEDLAKHVAELMLEDAESRHAALVELRKSIIALDDHKYQGVIKSLSQRIWALSRIQSEDL